jgi:8-oxo-dGTP pyrophosphatase MutT (NUDIX family)
MSDYEHGQALRKTGFWGKQGAGAIIMAKSTGRFLVPFRSAMVEQPNTWGVWGGAIDSGEDPKLAAKREVQEEAGYRGGDVIMVPLYVFHDQKSGFKYYNFLAVIDDEFTPNLNWETENFEWVDFDKIRHLEPLHFGLKALLQHSGNDIHKVVDKVKGSETINESDGNPIVISRQ